MLPLHPLVFVAASYVMASLKAKRMSMGTQCSLSISALMSLDADAIASLYDASTFGSVAIALSFLCRHNASSVDTSVLQPVPWHELVLLDLRRRRSRSLRYPQYLEERRLPGRKVAPVPEGSSIEARCATPPLSSHVHGCLQQCIASLRTGVIYGNVF